MVNQAIENLKKARVVVLVDDTQADCAGYLVAPSSSITPETISLMANDGRGVICAAMTEQRIRELGLPRMIGNTLSSVSPSFTVSVESRRGVSTGISAADRAKTLRTLAVTKDPRRDLVMPGHIFPIAAQSGGVLVRSGAPEAAIDLMLLSGLLPIATMCHCLDYSGELAGKEALLELAERLSTACVSVTQLVAHRMASESLIERLAESKLPTHDAGIFQAIAYRSLHDSAEHLALVKGDISKTLPVLARVQAEHRVGDLIGTSLSPNRESMRLALKAMEKEGSGVFVYLRHPKKGFLAKQVNKLANKAQAPSPSGDLLRIGVGAQILLDLGAKQIRLLTDSTRDIPGLKGFPIEIAERVPLRPPVTQKNCSA